jgi:hypothetical protein
VPSAPPTSGGIQTALAFLEVGPMHANTSQADTLEDELDTYLEASIRYANVVEFWQVCVKCKMFTVEKY